MGLLSKFKKAGGGFLNNVDALIVGLRFTDAPSFGGKARPAPAEGKFTALWAELTVRADGSEAPETTHLFAGDAGEFVISDDGTQLTPIEPGVGLWGTTAFANFYESAVKAGLPDDVEVEDGEPLDFSGLVGARVRLVQVKDVVEMERQAKRAAKSKGAINAQGQRKGKDGKYYDIRTLNVQTVYSVGNEVDVPASAPAAKSTAAKSAPKAGRKSAVNPIAGEARNVLIGILTDATDNLIAKDKLNLAVTRRLTASKHPQREEIRQFLASDENINAYVAEGVIAYEDGVIELAS